MANHGWNDGVQRPLAGTYAIGMARYGNEAGAAVLQHDPGCRRYDSRAEAVVDRIDERDRQAIAVDDRQVDRIRTGQWNSRGRVIDCAAHVDETGKTIGHTGAQELPGGRIHHLGDMTVAYDPGKFHRFDLAVAALDTVRAIPIEIEAGENVEGDE